MTNDDRYACLHLYRGPEGWVVWDYDRRREVEIAGCVSNSEDWARKHTNRLNNGNSKRDCARRAYEAWIRDPSADTLITAINALREIEY